MKVRLISLAVAAIAIAGCSSASSAGGGEGTVAAGGGPGGTGASCAAPTLTAKPDPVKPGESIDVHGDYFESDCNDTGQQSTPPPLTDLTLQLTQDGHTWSVATGINPEGELATFDQSVHLPNDLTSGKAILQVKDHGLPLELHVGG
jgi:hypothetical protein